MNIIVLKSEAGERIDALLARKLPSYSRSYFADQIRKGGIKVNDQITKPSYITKENDNIQVQIEQRPRLEEVIPQAIDLKIIYEDNDVIVIDKQPGILVHPGAGNPDHTIVNALLHYFPQIKEAVFEKDNPISEIRPGIVHRLDKDTSGVMIVAKNDRAMHSLAKQIQNRSISKTYLALCYGWPKQEEGALVNFLGRHPQNRKIVAEIGSDKGKEAISNFKVRNYYTYQDKKVSLVEFKIQTGRTHQIRVQSKLIGNPVIGDSVYGTRDSLKLSKLLGVKRQLLHAFKLSITLPGAKGQQQFTAPVPEDFTKTINQLLEI